MDDSVTQRRLRDLQQLLEVTRRLGATVELEPLLEQIAAAATAVMDCDRATVFVYDRPKDELYSRFATGVKEAGFKEIRFSAARGIAGEAVRSGKIINVADAYADPRFNPDIDKGSGFRTQNLLTCPLRGHDNSIVGVLQLLNKRGRPFDANDEELVNYLSAQAGVAIQRQMLLEDLAEKIRIKRDLNLARDIQQGLIPDANPEIAGYDVAGWNKPADETGGDCFDFMLLDGGNLAITIADATGHGIGPALVIAECRALFRATISLTQDLSRVVSQVNKLLCEDLPDDRFVTAYFGVLAPAEHRLSFLSAGHGPLLTFTAATDEIQSLGAHGLPLGIMDDADYGQPDHFPLAPGDMKVLFTDGFIEWSRQDGEQFGAERLYDLIRRYKTLPAADIIQRVYSAVLEFAPGTSQADDLTAVIVKRV